MGDLEAAKAGFLVHDELFDPEGDGDAIVAEFDGGDGLIGLADLPKERAGSGEESDYGDDNNLAEDVIETGRVQAGAPVGLRF